METAQVVTDDPTSPGPANGTAHRDPAGAPPPPPTAPLADAPAASAEADTTDDAAPAGPAGPAPAAVRRRRWLAAVVAAAVLAIAVAGGWILGARGEGGDELADSRDVAGRFAAAYLTFDAESVDRAGDRLLALATARFAREFESTRLPGVEAVFAEGGTSTVAEVTDVFTTPIVEDRVRAIVVVDVDANGAEGSQRLVNLSFVLELVEVDGDWRVDAVAPIPIPQMVGDDAATTTTAPPASAPTTPATSAPTTARP